jgi:hypothetical protein
MITLRERVRILEKVVVWGEGGYRKALGHQRRTNQELKQEILLLRADVCEMKRVHTLELAQSCRL